MPTLSGRFSRHCYRVVFVAVLVGFTLFPKYLYAAEPIAPFPPTPQWDLQPSLKFDAICALNMLSGDPYYLAYYQADYDRLSKKFRPEELAAFVNLKRRIKDR